MCWVAMDRAAKLADIRGENDARRRVERRSPRRSRPTSSSTASTNAACCASTTTTDSLDASTLLAAIFGFLPGDDERLRASVLAIADELTENGFVLRYRTDETDDGLSGKEGTFVICSFWLVSALAIIGEMQRARDLMARLVQGRVAARAVRRGVRRRNRPALGNFPQAFSHLALVEAAGRIILAERMQELLG